MKNDHETQDGRGHAKVVYFTPAIHSSKTPTSSWQESGTSMKPFYGCASTLELSVVSAFAPGCRVPLFLGFFSFFGGGGYAFKLISCHSGEALNASWIGFSILLRASATAGFSSCGVTDISNSVLDHEMTASIQLTNVIPIILVHLLNVRVDQWLQIISLTANAKFSEAAQGRSWKQNVLNEGKNSVFLNDLGSSSRLLDLSSDNIWRIQEVNLAI
jgi:hypothetical protein